MRLSCGLLLFLCVPGALSELRPETANETSLQRVIRLTPGMREVRPGPYLDLLEDPDGRLTFPEIRSAPRERWRSLDQRNPNLGFSNSVYWVRFRLLETDPGPRQRYLELQYPHLDYLQFYQMRDGEWHVSRTGDQLSFSSREINHRNFIFRMVTGPRPAHYYLRLQSRGSSVLPLVIRTDDHLMAHLDYEQLLLGLYYGVMGIMIIYNISLYFTVRAAIYLYYVLYVGSYSLLYLCWNGLAFQYIWPEGVAWSNTIVPVLVLTTNLLSLQFARAFLETKTNSPVRDKVLLGLMAAVAAVICVAAVRISPAVNYLIVAVTSLVLVTLLWMGVSMAFAGVRSARFYVIAMGAVLVGGLVAVFRVSGWIEASFLALWSNQIGTVVEVSLLSLALGDRINLIRAEREAARAEALEHRRRVDQLKDQFLSNISHELRTPLAEVYGYAEILVDESDGVREDLRPMTEAVHRASARLSELIQDLMLLTNLDTDLIMETEPLDLRRILEKDLEALRDPIADRGLAVVRRQAEEITVAGDDALLSKALYHILKNAVLYNRDGGLLEVDSRTEDGRVLISVRDTGIGIQPEELPRIWEKFYRVDSTLTYTVQGVGLGLFVARRILELHGGDISVESEVTMGSTFVVSLPVGPQPSPNEETAGLPAASGSDQNASPAAGPG